MAESPPSQRQAYELVLTALQPVLNFAEQHPHDHLSGVRGPLALTGWLQEPYDQPPPSDPSKWTNEIGDGETLTPLRIPFQACDAVSSFWWFHLALRHRTEGPEMTSTELAVCRDAWTAAAQSMPPVAIYAGVDPWLFRTPIEERGWQWWFAAIFTSLENELTSPEAPRRLEMFADDADYTQSSWLPPSWRFRIVSGRYTLLNPIALTSLWMQRRRSERDLVDVHETFNSDREALTHWRTFAKAGATSLNRAAATGRLIYETTSAEYGTVTRWCRSAGHEPTDAAHDELDRVLTLIVQQEPSGSWSDELLQLLRRNIDAEKPLNMLTFMPVAWFTERGIPADRLRKAAAPDRKKKRVRWEKRNGSNLYCVEDARAFWPQDFEGDGVAKARKK